MIPSSYIINCLKMRERERGYSKVRRGRWKTRLKLPFLFFLCEDMPADRKSNLAVPRHNPLAAPRSSTPLNRRGGSGSVPSERPVHGVRQVRELTNDERRRFNLEIYDAIDEDDPSTSTFSPFLNQITPPQLNDCWRTRFRSVMPPDFRLPCMQQLRRIVTWWLKLYCNLAWIPIPLIPREEHL